MSSTDDLSGASERQLGRLDDLERRAWEILRAPHYHVHEGSPVADPATGQPLSDSGPVLRALDVLLGVSEQRARILGLDQPQRYELVDAEGNTLDISQVAALLALLGRADK